ncbi:3,4-dihydroxy-2-butanone-4-phosphate synthase [Phycisphaerales bacterium AB-hyl4]|uniref:3,4-dihydroxy-2-butanone 4-phosphate synthase n=1 Tax=Natronomicrosphaera hydrolytica TaxID=3242702 RepID=A0ABV4U302_9BACT
MMGPFTIADSETGDARQRHTSAAGRHLIPEVLTLDSIADILSDLKAGRMIVLVDDEKRENEGDLVCAAEHVTPELVNFMLREGRGMMCVALEGEICDDLQLEPQARINTSQRSTAYTITVDAAARFGLTTGVSAADRAITIKTLIDPNTKPVDLDRPGHMQPLRARDGGCLVRAGQTEGSVDLCKLAGLRAGAVIIEVMNEDGTMARRPELEALCKKHSLKMCSVADVVHHRLERQQLVERIETLPFDSAFGHFNLIAYRSLVDPLPHIALTCGDVGQLDAAGNLITSDQPTLVRMHSQNLLGDVFEDVTQPSGQTLRQSMRMIQQAGRGAIVYLRHEGAGKGLLKRLQTAYRTKREADDAAEHVQLGDSHPTPGMMPPMNKGAYGIGCQILRDLGLHKLRLITNHPFTPTALSGFELTIDGFVPPTQR